MRDEIAMAASINATYSRPERFKPSCGTSDPGIMQLMMLPGTAMRDIMVHNVMTPFANLFRTRGHVHSSRGRREAGAGWSREQRRRFWRALGELARSEPGDQRGEEGEQPTTFTMPPDQSNVPKSRNRRSVIGLYSYAPWLSNDIPYVLSDDLNQDDRLTIAKAMEQIESDTCVKFVARGLSPYYVHIGRECSCGSNRCAFNGAYANIGPGPLPGLPSRMRILTCLHPTDADAVGIITHELMHNMGLLHTHTRNDRDQHVRINYLNVLPDKWIDYAWNPLQFSLDTDYDCDSIMHYRDNSFRSGLLGGGKTMEAVNPGRCNLRTRSATPTRADKRLIRTLYNC